VVFMFASSFSFCLTLVIAEGVPKCKCLNSRKTGSKNVWQM
jgi:hypothetical protein